MHLALRIVDDHTEAEVLALRSWLLRAEELGGQAVVGGTGPRADEMGEGLELISVVLSNSIALGSLVTSIAAWRGSRPGTPRVRIEIDGATVSIDTNDPEEIARITEALRRHDTTGSD